MDKPSWDPLTAAQSSLLRIMPAWEISFLGHTVTLSVLIPFAVPLTVVLGGAALWPFFERWATGDNSVHNINDRPRNAPVRTATGVAAMTFYAVLWIEGANDVIADNLSIPLYTITWAARVMVFLGPALAYVITKRVCLGLQRKDAGELLHGYESGIIRQLPNGEFIEVHRPVDEKKRAVLEAKPRPALVPASGPPDTGGVSAPASRGALGRIRARAGRAFAETIPLEVNWQAHGHRNGHGSDERAVPGRAGDRHGAASMAQLGPGDNPRDGSAHA